MSGETKQGRAEDRRRVRGCCWSKSQPGHWLTPQWTCLAFLRGLHEAWGAGPWNLRAWPGRLVLPQGLPRDVAPSRQEEHRFPLGQ